MNSLSNGFLHVYIKPQGAELCSIKSVAGTEYLWQADPAVWARHAPVLFPIIGKLRDGRYTLNGKTYALPQHGFARDMNFELIEQRQDALVYQLLPTEKTRACYPFEFALQIIYRLTGQTLSIEYVVRNNGSKTMPFSIGAHPGFTLPDPVEECFLEFEKEETLQTRLLSSSGLLSDETAPILNQSKILPLSKTLFDRDALIFRNVKSEKIILGSRNSRRHLIFGFTGFPQLGIWAKPGAPFVCIEPWHGHTDPEKPYGEITNKPGIIKLEAGGRFSCEHRVTIQD